MVELKHKANLPVSEFGKSLAAKRKHVDSIDHERTRVRSRQCAQNLKQCRLAGSGSTHDRNNLGLRDLKTDTFENLQAAE